MTASHVETASAKEQLQRGRYTCHDSIAANMRESWIQAVDYHNTGTDSRLTRAMKDEL